MGTNCALLLADLFLYSNAADFIQKLLHEKKKYLASTLWYIDDISSITDNQFHSYIDFIYPSELEIKDKIERVNHASYLDILFNASP